MGELGTTFYREEGRRVKLRVEKKSYSSLELSVRYNFKACVANPACSFSINYTFLHIYEQNLPASLLVTSQFR